jgi:hypothetical protein
MARSLPPAHAARVAGGRLLTDFQQDLNGGLRPAADDHRVTVRRTLLLAGAAAFAATVTAAVGVVPAAHDPGGAQAVAITVDAAHPGLTVPRSFVGLSFEVPAVARYAGSAAHPNRSLRGLLATLGAAQGSPPALRIGGNSSDESWWDPGPGGSRAPLGARYRLGPRWLARLAWVARVSRAPVTVGVNLAAGDPARALAFARALRAALPSRALRTIEIGNEPDLYTRRLSFRAGRVVVRRIARRARYDQSRYAADVRRYVALLSPGLGRRPALAAGDFGGVGWDAVLTPLLRAERGRIGALSAHAYPLNGCPYHAPRAPQLRRLLSAAASRELAAGVARMVAIGHRAGVAVRVTEMNSATCGGVPGISDTFASALWAPDALFAMARAGVTGVDLHSWPGAPDAPFAFSTERGGGTRAQARPLFYGLLLFAIAVGHDSRLLPAQASGDGAVHAWATLTRIGGVHLVVVNASAARVIVALRGAGARHAALRLMRGPGLLAHAGVTFAGRAIGADGRLHGRDRAVAIAPRAGRYTFALPAASAGLVTVAPPIGSRVDSRRERQHEARS